MGTEMYGRDAEIAEGEADADELGDDGEEVQEEQVSDREGPPELAEALVDEPGVADAGHRPEAHDHLLVHDQDRDEQGERPKQRGPEVLARLGVGGHAAGIVVPTITIRPGPMMASRVRSFLAKERRAARSCSRIVPKAPWMSPTCALSETARRAGAGTSCRRGQCLRLLVVAW